MLPDETRRSSKLWRLFTYLFGNRDKEVPTEILADYLWAGDVIADPQGALHNLIYRLRRIFDNLPCTDPPMKIEYSQVGYIARLGSEAWCDVDEFLVLTQRASSLHQTHST